MSCVSPQRSVGPVVCFESVIAAGRVCVCAWLALDAGVSMLGHSGDAVPGGRMRSETRMRDCLNRVGVAIIGCKFPHLAPCPPSLLPSARDSRRGEPPANVGPEDSIRTASRVGFRPEIRTGAGCGGTSRTSRGSSGNVFQLLGPPPPQPQAATPPPPPQPEAATRPLLPQPHPGAAALCLSRKMVWESLWGREGRPHHLPLNVNYAFMTVFIGSDAPRPPTPQCGPGGVGLFVAWAWGWAGRAPAGCRRCRRR